MARDPNSTLDGIIIGGATGNILGGWFMLAMALRHRSALMLVLGCCTLVIGCYILDAQREAMRRRRG